MSSSPPAHQHPPSSDEKDEGVASPNELSTEQSNDEATGLKPQGELERYAVDLLANIKAAQLQNGLRHGDYQRYRQYCARRLRRLRVGLHFTHGKKEFKPRTIEAMQVTDVRYLALPLVNAERAWAYAMQLKNDMTADTQRKRQHLVKRLQKAAQWAKVLEQLCAARADTRTQLQAEAYSAWLSGSVLFERNTHEKALPLFLHAKAVYEQLGSIGGASMQILCEERVASLQDSIRFCKYMLRNRAGESTDAEEEEALNHLVNSSANELLAAKLESLMKEKNLAQAQQLDTIEWQGKSIPVSEEKLRVCFVEALNLRTTLDKTLEEAEGQETTQAEVSADSSSQSAVLFQKLFSSYDEALKVLADALKEPKMLEQHKQFLLTLKDYATYSRLEVQLLRNTTLCSALESTLRAQEARPKEFLTKKKVKPDELVLMYEKISNNLQELSDIVQAHKNRAQVDLLAVRIQAATACRVFYLGESYRRVKQYIQAYLLYTRTNELVEQFEAAKNKLSSEQQQQIKKSVQRVEQLKKECTGMKANVHASALLAQAEKAAKAQGATASEKPTAPAVAAPSTQTLTARLDKWDSGDSHPQHALVDFPPTFQAAPAKPILFDLAFNAIQYPDISHKFKAAAPAQKTAAQKPKQAAAAPAAATSSAPAKQQQQAQQAKQPQPTGPKKIPPPQEKESVRRERLAREEQERKEAEEAAKNKGWGLGGLVGKMFGR